MKLQSFIERTIFLVFDMLSFAKKNVCTILRGLKQVTEYLVTKLCDYRSVTRVNLGSGGGKKYLDIQELILEARLK